MDAETAIAVIKNVCRAYKGDLTDHETIQSAIIFIESRILAVVQPENDLDDESTPENPREDGSYGKPMAAKIVEPTEKPDREIE